jgi:hypothetical protein
MAKWTTPASSWKAASIQLQIIAVMWECRLCVTRSPDFSRDVGDQEFFFFFTIANSLKNLNEQTKPICVLGVAHG